MKYILIIIVSLLVINCNQQLTPPKETHAYTNELIHESSPYLLQHAHNPVNWQPWSTKALAAAKAQNKLIIISVGYAACHWCHVMEHESFEDPEVAALMNTNYINIKVDREERPDIDQVYMNAVQLMTGSGGWPLNVIALPDGRPVWGGTYFAKENWMDALRQVKDLYTTQPDQLATYADKLEKGIKAMNIIEVAKDETTFDSTFIAKAVQEWSLEFDHEKGGTQRTPKFMMPANYHFLYRYAHQRKDSLLMKYVINTLTQISYGGVYDHVGGGFARYATDDKWHVPHFEKMLYDNAQLVSLYSDAYLTTQNPWFKTVVYETLDFVERELTNDVGAFYSSLDADSMTADTGELEEGAFYIWKKETLQQLLGDDYPLFAEYYNINAYGLWEKEQYVLIRKTANTEFATTHELTNTQLQEKVSQWKAELLKERAKRAKPRLDDKTLTSWNAHMLKGYIDAYRVFKDPDFLKKALKNATFIKTHQLQNDFSLLHTYKDEKSTINGYLEDYAAVIDAFIALYQNTFDQQWLDIATQLTEYTFTHFYDADTKFFYFTSDLDPELITRTIEHTDNVIPASNSIMANNLFYLYHYTNTKKYLVSSQQMLQAIQSQIATYPSGYANWLKLMLNYTENFYEVVVAGADAMHTIQELNTHYIPNKLVAGSTKPATSPLLEGRFVDGQTLIYICVDNACKFPVSEINEALELIE